MTIAIDPACRRRSGARAAGPSGARGFTIIELIAVMAVAAILAAAAIPALGMLDAGRSKGAAKQIVRDIDYARARAMTTGTVSWVVFDPGADTYSVLAESVLAPGRAGAATITDPATQAPFIVRLNQGEFAGADLLAANFGGAAEVGFDRLGRPLRSDGTQQVVDGTVTLSGGNTVTVSASSGRAAHTAGGT